MDQLKATVTAAKEHPAIAAIRSRGGFELRRIQAIEAEVKHDLIAFTTAVSEKIGSPHARWLHYGLTSNDVVDTAQNLLFKEASAIIIEDLRKLADVLKRRALEFQHTVAIGRTHGVHAEPITFGLKFANWYSETQRNIARMEAAAEQMAATAALTAAREATASVPKKTRRAKKAAPPPQAALVFDEIVPNGETSRLIGITIVLISLALASGLFAFMASYQFVRTGDSMEMITGGAVLDRILRLPASALRQWSSAALASRILLASALQTALGDAVKRLEPVVQQFLASALCLGLFTSARARTARTDRGTSDYSLRRREAGTWRPAK